MSAPKVYRTDANSTVFAKQFLGRGHTWSLAEMGEVDKAKQFTLTVQDHGSNGFVGWVVTRDEVADLWELLGEALHHD